MSGTTARGTLRPSLRSACANTRSYRRVRSNAGRSPCSRSRRMAAAPRPSRGASACAARSVSPVVPAFAPRRQQVAVEHEGSARQPAHRGLERRVAARVLAGVEVGEAVQRLRVRRLVAQQVRDAEVHSTAPREHFAADRPLDRKRIRVRRRVRLGEGDADLHRPAGAHRVVLREQSRAERNAGDEVLVDLAQLALGLRRASMRSL